MNIDLVALFYEPKRVRTTAAFIGRLARRMPIRSVVCVLNNPALSELQITALLQAGRFDLRFVAHDNTGQEFGGYQAGIDLILDRQADRTICLNDTVDSHQLFGPHTLDSFVAALLADAPISRVVGGIDFSSRSYAIDGRRSCRWVRTNFLGFDRSALDAISHRLYDQSVEALIIEDADPDKFFAAGLDPYLREHLQSWLFGPVSKGSWYGARALDDSSKAYLARKARAILLEKQLSLQLEEACVAFLPPSVRFAAEIQDAICRRVRLLP